MLLPPPPGQHPATKIPRAMTGMSSGMALATVNAICNIDDIRNDNNDRSVVHIKVIKVIIRPLMFVPGTKFIKHLRKKPSFYRLFLLFKVFHLIQAKVFLTIQSLSFWEAGLTQYDFYEYFSHDMSHRTKAQRNAD